MTVRVVGPWCIECQRLPALPHGLCAACDRTARLFGVRGPERLVVWSVSDPGFEASLRAWREGTA